MQMYFPEQASVLQSRMMIDWKRSRGVYNFTALPATAIICVDYAVLKPLVSFRSRKIRGIKGRHFVQQGILFCAAFDNGGPGILNLLEELRGLGVQRFVFIGLAGRLNDTIQEGQVLAVEKALSGCGAAAYYYPGNTVAPFNASFFTAIRNGLSISEAACFTTDAPFRETTALLDSCREQGASLIEMECAAIYAFSQFYRADAACLLIGADRLYPEWQPPADFPALISRQQSVVRQLIPILA